jgi:two-component system sensor histidine kinase/response regulator
LNSETTNDDTSPRILIVEDDDIQARVLAAGLEAAGFATDIVANGFDAVWEAQARIYDVILVDFQIPEIDGLAAARLIRDFSGPVARPMLIALTASPEALGAKDNSENAFDFIFGKSGDLSPLVATIERCLASRPDIMTRRKAASTMLAQAWSDCYSEPIRPGAQGDNPGPARILVVEDDDNQRLLLASVMRHRGYVVETASNGMDAIRKIREEYYDLALVDYKLPEIDGLAVVKLTHNLMDQQVRPRLIALTATPSRLREMDVSADIMFDKIVEKSSNFDELLNVVDCLLKSAPNPVTRLAVTSAFSVERLPSPA